MKKDSVAAKVFFAESGAFYQDCNKAIAEAKSGNTTKELKQFDKYFDSISTTIKFLKEKVGGGKTIKTALETTQRYSQLLQANNEIKRSLSKRSKLLRQSFGGVATDKQLRKLQTNAYVLKEKISGYRKQVADRKAVEKKFLSALRKDRRFTDFMKSKGWLATFFPPSEGSAAANSSLQTIASVQAQINQRFGNSGVDPRQFMNQQVSVAQNRINDLKARLNKIKAGSSSDPEMPQRFNAERGKSFMKRLTWETNFHTQHIQVTMTDVAVTVGYKINDKSVFSLGGSARVGLGKDWNSLKLTSEGYGLRSVLDMKLKHSIWMMGSYETNYYSRFAGAQYSAPVNPWQANILVGFMKRIQITSKKNGMIRLAYNVLYKQNRFITQPVVFKVGYGF